MEQTYSSIKMAWKRRKVSAVKLLWGTVALYTERIRYIVDRVEGGQKTTVIVQLREDQGWSSGSGHRLIKRMELIPVLGES